MNNLNITEVSRAIIFHDTVISMKKWTAYLYADDDAILFKQDCMSLDAAYQLIRWLGFKEMIGIDG